MPTKLPQNTIDRIANDANIYVEWKFNGGVSPTTEAHCLDCYIAAATIYETRIIELVNALEDLYNLTYDLLGGENAPDSGEIKEITAAKQALTNYKKQ